MTFKRIPNNDPIATFPAYFNVYPVTNEFHARAVELAQPLPKSDGFLYLDDYYGRIYDHPIAFHRGIYGKSEKMEYYHRIEGLDVVDELRVPYRKIPVYRISSLREMSKYVLDI